MFKVNIKKEYKYLGVIKANPVEYINRYGDSLTISSQLPHFVREIKNPRGLVLAADLQENHNKSHELYGDVQALGLVDLEREGLGEYRDQLSRLGVRTRTPIISVDKPPSTLATANSSTATTSQNNRIKPAYFDTLASRPPRQRSGLGSASRLTVSNSQNNLLNDFSNSINNISKILGPSLNF